MGLYCFTRIDRSIWQLWPDDGDEKPKHTVLGDGLARRGQVLVGLLFTPWTCLFTLLNECFTSFCRPVVSHRNWECMQSTKKTVLCRFRCPGLIRKMCAKCIHWEEEKAGLSSHRRR